MLGTPYWSMISSLLHLVGLRPRVYYTLTNFFFLGGEPRPPCPPPLNTPMYTVIVIKVEIRISKQTANIDKCGAWLIHMYMKCNFLGENTGKNKNGFLYHCNFTVHISESIFEKNCYYYSQLPKHQLLKTFPHPLSSSC